MILVFLLNQSVSLSPISNQNIKTILHSIINSLLRYFIKLEYNMKYTLCFMSLKKIAS